MEIKISAVDSCKNDNKIHLLITNKEGAYCSNLKYTPREPGTIIPQACVLTRSEAEYLLTSLWGLGIRPYDQGHCYGRLRATEDNLVSTIEINNRLLDIVGTTITKLSDE